MTGTVVVRGSVLRRAGYLVAALLAAILVVAGVVVLAPAEDERFGASVEGMLAVVRTMSEGEEIEERSIGNLSFERVFRDEGMVYFQRGTDWDGRPYGYLYSPRTPSFDVWHVEGPWYAYSDLEQDTPA